jgi:hypothetical protein
MMHLASYKGPATGLLHRTTHWLITHLKPRRWWPYLPALYSHNELVFEIKDGMAECASSSVRDGGVRFKRIDIFSGRWDVKPLPQYDDNEELSARWWLIKHEGEGYDYLGVAAFIKTFSALVRECSDRWFCSEAIAAALCLPDPASLSPQDLDDLLSIPSPTKAADPK